MKKYVFSLLLLAVALAAVGENLTLISTEGGPEHGTWCKYKLVSFDQVNKVSSKEIITSDSIFNFTTSAVGRRYLGDIFFTGSDFDEKAVITAAKGEKVTIAKEKIKEEAGYTHWGFIKNYQIKTPTTTYALISKSPLIVAANEKIYYAPQSRFHFGSVAALIAILLFGIDLGAILSLGPKEWWRQRNHDGIEFPELILFGLEIYAIIWSLNVGEPFIYLALGALLLGIIMVYWRKIFPKKEEPREPTIIEIPGLQ
jgi:hypothetical protein